MNKSITIRDLLAILIMIGIIFLTINFVGIRKQVGINSKNINSIATYLQGQQPKAPAPPPSKGVPK